MKREIKFRAFNKNTSQLCHVLLICFVNKYVDVLPIENLEGGNQEEWLFNNIELMQFTGLKDKNGSEIYEGDIVKVPNRKMKAKKQPFYNTEIVYRGHSFTLKENDTYFVDNASIGRYLEVIGNIYQNQELL